MPSMDVFENTVFGTRQLTAAVNNMDYVPGQVSSLGIFQENGVPVTTLMVERQGQTVALVPTTTATSPATMAARNGMSYQRRDTRGIGTWQ